MPFLDRSSLTTRNISAGTVQPRMHILPEHPDFVRFPGAGAGDAHTRKYLGLRGAPALAQRNTRRVNRTGAVKIARSLRAVGANFPVIHHHAKKKRFTCVAFDLTGDVMDVLGRQLQPAGSLR
jgi:hypothetical protein